MLFIIISNLILRSMSIKSIKEDLIKKYLGHIFGKMYCTHDMKKHAPYSISCTCTRKNHSEYCLYKAAEETFNDKFITKLFMFSKSSVGKTRKRCETLAHMASSGARRIASIKKMNKNSTKWELDDAAEIVRKGADSVSHLLLWNNQKFLDRKLKA
jgi:hypothetical protein